MHFFPTKNMQTYCGHTAVLVYIFVYRRQNYCSINETSLIVQSRNSVAYNNIIVMCVLVFVIAYVPRGVLKYIQTVEGCRRAQWHVYIMPTPCLHVGIWAYPMPTCRHRCLHRCLHVGINLDHSLTFGRKICRHIKCDIQ